MFSSLLLAIKTSKLLFACKYVNLVQLSFVLIFRELCLKH